MSGLRTELFYILMANEEKKTANICPLGFLFFLPFILFFLFERMLQSISEVLRNSSVADEEGSWGYGLFGPIS